MSSGYSANTFLRSLAYSSRMALLLGKNSAASFQKQRLPWLTRQSKRMVPASCSTPCCHAKDPSPSTSLSSSSLRPFRNLTLTLRQRRTKKLRKGSEIDSSCCSTSPSAHRISGSATTSQCWGSLQSRLIHLALSAWASSLKGALWIARRRCSPMIWLLARQRVPAWAAERARVCRLRLRVCRPPTRCWGASRRWELQSGLSKVRTGRGRRAGLRVGSLVIFFLIIIMRQKGRSKVWAGKLIWFWLQNIINLNWMKDQIVVSMTGFVRDPQEEYYKRTIGELGLRLASTLSEETSILIVNDVTTEKYKIAKTYDQPINCVTIEWLLECKRRNKVVGTECFQVKKMFHGAYIKVLGFEPEKSRRLEGKLAEHGGVVRVLRGNGELGEAMERDERVSLVLTTADNFARLRLYLDQIRFPVVGVEWLEDSLRGKLCKYPYDYALNQYYICTRASHEHHKKMRSKLELHLAREPSFKFEHCYLEDTLIYISENVRPDFARLLKKIVMVLGGFYLDAPSPVATHILTEPLTEGECSELTVYGSLVFVLRVEWLVDSIYLSKRMREEDYFIRSYKGKAGPGQLEEQGNNQNSTSFNSFAGSLPTLQLRKSISVQGVQGSVQKVKAPKKEVSSIFKGWSFYVESLQKREVELMDLPPKIRSHGGQVFDSRASIHHGHCFYVLKDGSESERLVERLKQDTKGQVQVQPVSLRWVSECIAKGQFIDIHRAESYIYKPFNFKTPIMGFHKMVFDVLGLDDVARLRLKELYNTLGSVRNTPNRSEITHCLCGDKFREHPRYVQIRKENASVKFIDWRWIVQCVNAGRIVECQKFLLDKESGSSTPEVDTNPQILPHPLTA